MGLTTSSTGKGVISSDFFQVHSNGEKVIALAGNPNVGKSTVFNELTGLNQHTGNWPGKTVTNAQGTYTFQNKDFILVDLPGTYSLLSSSVEEEVARDFICFGDPDATVVVVDATCLERNLNLLLQITELTDRVILCVNLLDEAKKKGILIDLKKLSYSLGVFVVGTSARKGIGLSELKAKVHEVSTNQLPFKPFQVSYPAVIEEAITMLQPVVSKYIQDEKKCRWVCLKLLDSGTSLKKSLVEHLNVDFLQDHEVKETMEVVSNFLQKEGVLEPNDLLVSTIVQESERITRSCITFQNPDYSGRDRKLDKILTSKIWGIPFMVALLGCIFWITIVGANYPSAVLSELLFGFESHLSHFFMWLHMPMWLHDSLVFGVYRTLAWVISVMLPPMAIFFPLFTLLEDSGYLPRLAFNMDCLFKKACCHGKQALTMCMGFGCNACGVIGCRIIDSPRERMIAILTNCFVPCNGRFPTLIAIITMFFAGIFTSPWMQSLASTVLLTFVIVLGVCMTLLVSKFLSKTVLKGMPSSFILELPPYRKPQIGKVIIRSVLDRTLFVLGRAMMVAAPAGLIIWCCANIMIDGQSILALVTSFLDPFARLFGLDGVIMMAFILGFPANEIVMPIIIMSYLATGSMVEFDNLLALKELLVEHGWTFITAICTMLFALIHFPCGTTCLTIKKETGSFSYTILAILLPTIIGLFMCFIVAQIGNLFF